MDLLSFLFYSLIKKYIILLLLFTRLSSDTASFLLLLHTSWNNLPLTLAADKVLLLLSTAIALGHYSTTAAISGASECSRGATTSTEGGRAALLVQTRAIVVVVGGCRRC